MLGSAKTVVTAARYHAYARCPFFAPHPPTFASPSRASRVAMVSRGSVAPWEYAMSLVLNVSEKAAALIKQFGPDARSEAARYAEEMRLAGKLYERRTWRRVQEAIDQLLSVGDDPRLTSV